MNRTLRKKPLSADYHVGLLFGTPKVVLKLGNEMMIRKYFSSICKDWIALITGIASVPLTVAAFYVNSPIIRYAWYISAWSCFIVTTYRVWANEYRRTEKAEKQSPFVIIDKYSSFYAEDDMTGNEILIENIRIVNRGQSAALNIEIPSIRALGLVRDF